MMPCNFNEYPCDGVTLTVLLTICPEGHIRENYLCPKHHFMYMNFIRDNKMYCMECDAEMSREWLQEAL